MEQITMNNTIVIDDKFFGHLLDCMCNQKYLPTLAASDLASEREKHDQAIIDTAYHKARELWLQNIEPEKQDITSIEARFNDIEARIKKPENIQVTRQEFDELKARVERIAQAQRSITEVVIRI
jgi:hypothetical protein